MYEKLCQLERFLHRHVRIVLGQIYGAEWWDELPLTVRTQCADRRERDDPKQRGQAYLYTTFVDLHDIFKEHWSHLSEKFPGPVRANREDFLSQLQTLNGIRNRIMHPVREYTTQVDFEIVSRFARAMFA